MDLQTFLSVYPPRADDSDKTQDGRILLVAGSYGMAGACSLAQIGAHCLGASTSPALSNLVMTEFDEYMGSWCSRRGVSYTRYSDDLTFSSDKPLYPAYLRTKEKLRKMGFEINEKKTHFLTSHTRQQVTGIVVNEKINISSDYRRKLRQEIHYVLQYGAEDAFSRVRDKDGVSAPTARHYLLSLLGRMDYVLQVRRDDAYFKDARRKLARELSRMDTAG